ncbi:hypothetical protein BC938DRAFT_475919 [Jimgerdemannia flammicorona]|uniref:Uncharacterized protein n=1 Tax=Jimgerdemannia flammicorona TaxID=994334 RepID=A0A433PMF0_9FUNG|nr:hypothetical protein BC938DRAFT_475919 [Jimgerdemannia flammicorona]
MGRSKRSRIDGEVDGEEEIDEEMDEEMPLVIVGGEMIPLDEVTEDHQQQMSSEEYQVCRWGEPLRLYRGCEQGLICQYGRRLTTIFGRGTSERACEWRGNRNWWMGVSQYTLFG